MIQSLPPHLVGSNLYIPAVFHKTCCFGDVLTQLTSLSQSHSDPALPAFNTSASKTHCSLAAFFTSPISGFNGEADRCVDNFLCFIVLLATLCALSLFHMLQLKWRMKMGHVYLMCCGKCCQTQLLPIAKTVMKLRLPLQTGHTGVFLH